MDTKTCTKCRETKPLEAFSNSKSRKDGKDPWCKACTHVAIRAWRERNPDKVRAMSLDANRAWRERNPDKARENGRKRNQRQNKRNADALTDIYVARQLQMPRKDVAPELLEMKRQQLKLAREIRSLRKTLKDSTDGNSSDGKT